MKAPRLACRRRWLPLLLGISLLIAPSVRAQTPGPTGGSPWVLVPQFFTRGALISLLGGNPNEAGPLYVRLSLPNGYRMRPHSHPRPLHVEIIQGTLRVGLGKRFDLEQTREMVVGDTATVPANTPYYYAAKGWTILDARTEGPFQLTYVNPEHDPSRQLPFGQ